VGYAAADSFGTGDWEGVSGKGKEDAIIVKYDHDGNVVWQNNFGGNEYNMYYGVTAVPDGVVAVGNSSFDSFGTGDWEEVSGKGGTDAIIVKYDNNGNAVWKSNFGGNGYDIYYGVTAVQDGVVAVGSSGEKSFGNGDWEGFLGMGGPDAIIVKYEAVQPNDALVNLQIKDFTISLNNEQLTVQNPNQTDVTGVVIIAVYEENKLVELHTTEIKTFPGGEDTTVGDISLVTQLTQNHETKAFLWDGTDSMRPWTNGATASR